MGIFKDWFNSNKKTTPTSSVNTVQDSTIIDPADIKPGKMMTGLSMEEIDKMTAEMNARALCYEQEYEAKRAEFKRQMQQSFNANKARAAAQTGTTTASMGVPKNNDLPTVEHIDYMINMVPIPRWQAVIMVAAILDGKSPDEAAETAAKAEASTEEWLRKKLDGYDGKKIIQMHYIEQQRQAVAQMEMAQAHRVSQMYGMGPRRMITTKDELI